MTDHKKVDSTGRVMFTVRTQNYNPDFVPEEVHFQALEFIHRHTYCASNILFEFMKGLRESKRKDNFLAWLKDFYDSDLIERPDAQQYTVGGAERNYHVYAVSERGKRLLEQEGRLEPVIRHSGYFPHQLMGATDTATIDIMCRREGYRFIPAHEYLGNASKKVTIPFEWTEKGKTFTVTDNHATFDPDYIFGIQYPDGYMTFMREYSRDTEPQEPSTHRRRSDLKTIRQLKTLIGKKEYKKLYGRTAPVMYTFVTVTEERAARFIEIATRELGNIGYITAAVLPSFKSPFRPPQFPQYLFDEPMLHTKKEEGFTIRKI